MYEGKEEQNILSSCGPSAVLDVGIQSLLEFSRNVDKEMGSRTCAQRMCT